jgi:hypothetical protein
VSTLAAQVVFTNVQVADRIRKVEDGVDEFRKWAENRADQGKNNAEAAKASGRTRGRTASQRRRTSPARRKTSWTMHSCLKASTIWRAATT